MRAEAKQPEELTLMTPHAQTTTLESKALALPPLRALCPPSQTEEIYDSHFESPAYYESPAVSFLIDESRGMDLILESFESFIETACRDGNHIKRDISALTLEPREELPRKWWEFGAQYVRHLPKTQTPIFLLFKEVFDYYQEWWLENLASINDRLSSLESAELAIVERLDIPDPHAKTKRSHKLIDSRFDAICFLSERVVAVALSTDDELDRALLLNGLLQWTHTLVTHKTLFDPRAFQAFHKGRNPEGVLALRNKLRFVRDETDRLTTADFEESHEELIQDHLSLIQLLACQKRPERFFKRMWVGACNLERIAQGQLLAYLTLAAGETLSETQLHPRVLKKELKRAEKRILQKFGITLPQVLEAHTHSTDLALLHNKTAQQTLIQQLTQSSAAACADKIAQLYGILSEAADYCVASRRLFDIAIGTGWIIFETKFLDTTPVSDRMKKDWKRYDRLLLINAKNPLVGSETHVDALTQSGMLHNVPCPVSEGETLLLDPLSGLSERGMQLFLHQVLLNKLSALKEIGQVMGLRILNEERFPWGQNMLAAPPLQPHPRIEVLSANPNLKPQRTIESRTAEEPSLLERLSMVAEELGQNVQIAFTSAFAPNKTESLEEKTDEPEPVAVPNTLHAASFTAEEQRYNHISACFELALYCLKTNKLVVFFPLLGYQTPEAWYQQSAFVRKQFVTALQSYGTMLLRQTTLKTFFETYVIPPNTAITDIKHFLGQLDTQATWASSGEGVHLFCGLLAKQWELHQLQQLKIFAESFTLLQTPEQIKTLTAAYCTFLHQELVRHLKYWRQLLKDKTSFASCAQTLFEESYPLLCITLKKPALEQALSTLSPDALSELFKKQGIPEIPLVEQLAKQQDRKGNTLLHYAMMYYAELSDEAKKEVLWLCLFNPTDIKNHANQTPLDCLHQALNKKTHLIPTVQRQEMVENVMAYIETARKQAIASQEIEQTASLAQMATERAQRAEQHLQSEIQARQALQAQKTAIDERNIALTAENGVLKIEKEALKMRNDGLEEDKRELSRERDQLKALLGTQGFPTTVPQHGRPHFFDASRNTGVSESSESKSTFN